MEYTVLSDPENIGLDEAFKSQSPAIEKAVRRPLDQRALVDGQAPPTNEADLISQEEQEVQNATFLLRLVKLS